MKYNFCTTDTEKSHQLKKYKPPVLIVLVASILIFSMLSTSVFASNVINLDYNTYKYLMSLDNVNYAINYDGYGLQPLTSINATISTIPESQPSDPYLDSPVTSNINGRYITSFTMYYGTYLYIPIMLSDIDTISFDFYCGVDNFNVLNSIDINSVSLLDFFGTEMPTLSLTYSTLSDPSFYKSYNLVTAPDSALPQWTPNLSVRPYHIDAEFPIEADVGFIRIVMSSVYGSGCTMFYGANNFNITSPDRQMTSLSTIIQGNFSSVITYLTQINGNMNLNHQQTVSLLNQIINIELQDQEQVSEIQQAMDELQSSLDQIGQDLNSIARPPADDFDFDFDTVTDGKADFSAFNSDDSIFVEIFNDDLTGTMLKSVLSICSIGFILFGKR